MRFAKEIGGNLIKPKYLVVETSLIALIEILFKCELSLKSSLNVVVIND